MPDDAQSTATPQVVPVVTETSNALVAPVVDVTGKVATLEQKHEQQEATMYRQLADLEERMSQRFNERDENFYSKYQELASKIEGMTKQAEEPIQENAENILDVNDVIEASPEEPEKMKRGLRGRKKSKRKTRN